MTSILSTNITSPLGYTTEENYSAIRSGRSMLSRHEGWKGIPEPFAASLFTDGQMERLAVKGYTRFESIAIRSMEEALSHTDTDMTSPRTVFILSTTKANAEELASDPANDGHYLAPGETAKKIAGYFGMSSEPVVVCNACISGAAAQLLADRLIGNGMYDTAIICGADCQPPFIVAGFMSFKSLSPEDCRPFDMERSGLNLGEAAATVIYGRTTGENHGRWMLRRGSLGNDAYHLSAPDPTGEGILQVITQTLQGYDKDSLALVSAHGTATMFNDQMESKAIERASLSSVPVSALKGYYGHTMGAAGVLEAIITMRALDDGIILPVRGFSEIGVSGRITVCDREQQTDKRSFLKIISGFGGCNGALLFSKGQEAEPHRTGTAAIKTVHSLHLTPDSLTIDGEDIPVTSKGKTLLTELYKKHIGEYPKFYKMDTFSRLVFVASELLVMKEGGNARDEGRAVVLFNGTSSVIADRKHIGTISDRDNFFPSPSTFLYTLPNIAAGEIAIRNSYKGETSFYILAGKDEELMSGIIEATFAGSSAGSMITGWVDCSDEDVFEADIRIIYRQ